MIGEGCSITVQRSRGCHANSWATSTSDAVLAEAKALLAHLDRAAAVRLAQLVRMEALEERSLAAQLLDDDEPALARLVAKG